MLNRVREIRKRKGLTQKELAVSAHIGQVTISNIETERYVPRVDVALSIAAVLETTVEELFIIKRGPYNERR